MNDILDDRALDAALHTLDPAPDLDDDARRRRDALLETILATPLPRDARPDRDIGRAAVFARRRPARSRRATVARWAIPATVAAGIAVAVAVTGRPGDDRVAYASWTVQPQAVDAAALAADESACRAALAETVRNMSDVPPSERPLADPAKARTVAAERRGDFVLLSMATPDGSSQQCFFDADEPGRVQGSTGGLATAASPPPTTLGPAAIDVAGGGQASGPDGTYSFAEGRVGRDVRAVTVHAEGRTVQATVSNGHLLAWWPAAAATGPLAPTPLVTYDVTLRDGRVIANAPDPNGIRPPGPRQVGGIEQGGGAGEDGAAVSTVAGHVGAEVVGVVVHDGDRSIPATVSDGVFTAQWPGGSGSDALTYDLTLRDGTVLARQKAVPSRDE